MGPVMDARKFASEWEEAWNSHDIDRIMGHYRDDIVFRSGARIAWAFRKDSPLLESALNKFVKPRAEQLFDKAFNTKIGKMLPGGAKSAARNFLTEQIYSLRS